MAGSPEERAAWLDVGQRLVKKLAFDLSQLHGLPRDELLAIGNVVVVELLDRFEPSQEVAFTTFAWRRIRGEMLDQGRRIRLGEGRRVARALLGPVADELEPEGDAHDDDATIVARIIGRATELAASYALSSSFSAPDEGVLAEERERGEAILREAVAGLGEPDGPLLQLYYFEGKTLKQVAEALGIPYRSIKRYHRQALARVGKRMRMLAP